MPDIILVSQSFEETSLLHSVKSEIHDITGFTPSIQKLNNPIKLYYDPGRDQYDALKIIQANKRILTGKKIICINVDLYIPIFTFVFGLASLGGDVGIVSTHRLDNRFYGLPADNNLLQQRFLKEIVHETGHLCGLRHCANYQCVMASSNSADEIDLKPANYCPSCRNGLG